MNKFLLFLGAALWVAGCARQAEVQPEAIALFYAAEEASKTDALAEGDEVFVSASVEGTGNYFLENSRWTVGPDGKALVPAVPVFYPDPKEAVAFYAYFGAQHVPTDQSAPADLKKADLCWASASSTPSSAPVPLTFSHVFARLAVTCGAPTSKITILNAFSGGTLDIRTGSFTNSTKSDISTTGNELILPAQTLNRLVLTSGGVEYVFEGSIVLEAGKTTSVNLTLNSSTQTATLSGSSVSAWSASAQSGNVSQAVSNVLSLYWPSFIQQGALPDKVVLAVNGSDYTVSSGITYANKTFTVPFASTELRYPYAITKITFYSGSTQVFPSCTQLLGSTVYKSTAQTLGIKDLVANIVKIGNLWWATGNLIADGTNGCKIGASTDCGLYFQFGSLIGWSGGAAATGYDGRGSAVASPTTVKVKPSNLHASYDPGTTWPTGGTSTQLNKSYFSVSSSPYSNHGTNIGSYAGAPSAGTGVDLTKSTLSEGRYAPLGVGDPCTYYLGSEWHTPLYEDFTSLTGISYGSGQVPYVGLTKANGTNYIRWTRAGVSIDGAICNLRDAANGSYVDPNNTWDVAGWQTLSCSTYPNDNLRVYSRFFYNNTNWLPDGTTSIWSLRTTGFPVRCVSNAP